MSYLDDPKRGYSHPLLGPPSLQNPSFPPVGGNLPASAGNILVDNANHQALITLPTTGTNEQVIVVQRTSTNPVSVAFLNSDLGENVAIALNESVRFVWAGGMWRWLEPNVVQPRVTISAKNPGGAYPGWSYVNGQNTIGQYRYPQVGDIVVQTVDGTSATPTISTWEFNGFTWLQIATGSETTTARPVPITTEPVTRSYHGAIAVRNERWTNVSQRTAAAVAAMGFEAVGTATILDYNTLWQQRAIAQFTAPQPASQLEAALHTIPNNYIRHTVAITPLVDNLYTLNVIGDRLTALCCWVCDPTTGVPVKRLAAQCVSVALSGKRSPIQMSVAEEAGADHSWFETIGFGIPKALIAAYKTTGNTIKLALTAAPGNQGVAEFFLNGFATCEMKISYTITNAHSITNRMNAGVTATLGAIQDGMMSVGINQGSSIDLIRIPLIDTDRDIFLSLVGNSNSNGSSVQPVEAIINSANGVLPLHRPKPMLKSPLAVLTVSDVGGGHDVSGWVLTSRQLKQFATVPNNSGVPYLDLTLKNYSANEVPAIAAIVTEAIS